MDWYDNGMIEMHQECADSTGLTVEQVKSVYSFLSEIGIIDYDIEKDVVFDRYSGEEDS